MTLQPLPAAKRGACQDSRALLDAAGTRNPSDDPVRRARGVARNDPAKARAPLAARAGG